MQLSAISLALTRLGWLSTFTPASLFTTGVNGAWYDPSDLATLYRDAAGTQPVTAVEQPVGLMLDKSKGLVLGPELVTNGDFSNGTTGWTTPSGWGVSAAVMNKFAGVANALTQTISSTTAKWYRVSATVVRNSGTLTVSIGTSGNTSGSISASGTYTWTLLAGSGTQDLSFFADASFAGTLDNISVRELPGNHAFNSSGNSANFPVLSARVNLLTKTEDFADAVWQGNNRTVTVNQIVAPDGTTTADLVTLTSAGGDVRQLVPSLDATSYIFTFYAKTVSGSLSFPAFIIGGNGTVALQQTVTLTDVWQKFTLTSTVAAGTNGRVQVGGSSLPASGSQFYIWGADLRVANDALNQPAYQRVNTATDYDTVGFKPYLRFNGTNQWLQTNSIDFSATDKMFVSAGVRQLSNANYAGLVGLSANVADPGSMLVWLRGSAGGGQFEAYARGSSSVTTGNITGNSALAVPASSVFSVNYDMSQSSASTEILARQNGSPMATTGASAAGAGTFGNSSLNIGQYNSSNYFNGRLYGMVIAGKQASAAEITSTETYINQKTGAWS